MTHEPTTSILEVDSVSKSFVGRAVLREVSLDLRPGEVHGLVGQNGSGKSTLIKILSGHHGPDRDTGRLTVRGELVDLPLSPTRSSQLGLAFVHQELPTASGATVLENLRIGRFRPGFGGRINWRSEVADAREALRAFGVHAHPLTQIDELPDVERAMIAILRALEGLEKERPGVLVLDEPTAYLPSDGVERLFKAIASVAARGHAVLLVTHRLEELLTVTDRITVLRDGMVALASRTDTTSESDLVRAILGFDVGELYPSPPQERASEPVLRAVGLEGARVALFDFEASPGEIVGLTGLMGSGYEELPYLLFGAKRGHGGTVQVDKLLTRQADLRPDIAVRAGVALLPADRRGSSGVLDRSMRENVTLPTLRRHVRHGRVRMRRERRHVRSLLEQYDVRPPAPESNLGTLSGGNQQKALLAKWFDLRPRVLILHEPTQGVDVGSRKVIFEHIRAAADSGVAVVIASAEYEDLAHLCTRVVVFRKGRQAASLSGSELTEHRIAEQCMRDDRAAAV